MRSFDAQARIVLGSTPSRAANCDTLSHARSAIAVGYAGVT